MFPSAFVTLAVASVCPVGVEYDFRGPRNPTLDPEKDMPYTVTIALSNGQNFHYKCKVGQQARASLLAGGTLDIVKHGSRPKEEWDYIYDVEGRLTIYGTRKAVLKDMHIDIPIPVVRKVVPRRVN